ncbi:MAG: hypothetical protein K6F75_02150 [Butyrivibrio sp.]|nr:hypothetical protein [Butyrivibrio sp.]
MKGKKYLAVALIMSALLLVGGCGDSFPELTDEEYDQTVEFAVGLLLKYSNNDQSKLAKVDVKELKKQREKEARAAAQEEKKREETEKTQTPQPTTPAPVTTVPETKAPEVKEENTEETIASAANTITGEDEQILTSDDLASPVSDNASEDETIEEATSEEETAAESTNPNAVIMSSEYSQEIINGILLSYQGYSVSSTYPESSKSYVINADKGKKLLVLRFDLYNSAESDVKVNMIEKGIQVQTILNGKNLGYNAVTFLSNDLTSFVGTIEPKAHESLVVLSEIDEKAATNIQTLGMIFNIGGKEIEVILK